jgi:putative PIN family toxin of toxin-antitoxin system
VVSRKQRIAVVLDTNVLVRALKTRSLASPNQRILRLWLLNRRLQLVVSRPLVAEYLEIFGELLELDAELLDEWEQRFLDDARSTVVNLGRRFDLSRDPDDNLLLATAAAGSVGYLISNDRDLLDIEPDAARRLTFEIVSPAVFLRRIEQAR